MSTVWDQHRVYVPSPHVAQYAHMLIDDGRVYPSPTQEGFAFVAGISELYQVSCDEAGVHCTCMAGSGRNEPSCGHAYAALVMFGRSTRKAKR